MTNEFTGVLERDGDRYISYCLGLYSTSGQGATLDECQESHCQTAKPILQDPRDFGVLSSERLVSHNAACRSTPD